MTVLWTVLVSMTVKTLLVSMTVKTLLVSMTLQSASSTLIHGECRQPFGYQRCVAYCSQLSHCSSFIYTSDTMCCQFLFMEATRGQNQSLIKEKPVACDRPSRILHSRSHGWVCVSETLIKLTTCQQALLRYSCARHGEYTLYPDAPQFKGRSATIFCNMSGDVPREYITLPHPNKGHFPDRTPNGKRQPKANRGFAGRTTWNKIGINIKTMVAIINERTYCSTTRTDKRVVYGMAQDCYSDSTSIGTFTINTLGTGVKFGQEVRWKSFGWKGRKKVTRRKHGAVIRLLCGGHCGGCIPVGDMALYPNPYDKL